MGFFTLEGIGFFGAIGVIYTAKCTEIIPGDIKWVAAIGAILYIVWYCSFCYKQAIAANPAFISDLQSKLNGGK